MRRRERELKVVNGHPAAVGFLKGPSGGAGHPGAGGGYVSVCVLPPPAAAPGPVDAVAGGRPAAAAAPQCSTGPPPPREAEPRPPRAFPATWLSELSRREM